MPFAATWMDLEIIILSKSERERQMPYITYMWILKCNTDHHQNRNRFTDREQTYCQRGVGVRKSWIKNLVLADVNYYI